MQGEFVRFGKCEVAYRDLSIHGKRVTLWVVSTAKVSPFYQKTRGYGLPDFAEELNYGVTGATYNRLRWGIKWVGEGAPAPLNPDTQDKPGINRAC